MTDLYPSRHGARAAFLPRIDPVLHGKWTPSAPISREQAQSFDRNGFLLLDDLFTPGEIASLQDDARAMLANPLALDAETLIQEPQSRDIRSIFLIHRQSRRMAKLAADERLAGIARFLLDDDVYIHQSRLNYKPGFQGKEFYWHSDFETWHVEDGMPRMRALSISILLAANDANNGPLMLVPGSHRKFLTCVGETPENHYRQSLKKQEYGVPDPDSLTALVNEHGIATATGAAGSVVIFDCNIMHGSNGNITPLPRSNAFFVYNAVSNRLEKPFGPKTPRPEFIAARDTMTVLRPATERLFEPVT